MADRRATKNRSRSRGQQPQPSSRGAHFGEEVYNLQGSLAQHGIDRRALQNLQSAPPSSRHPPSYTSHPQSARARARAQAAAYEQAQARQQQQEEEYDESESESSSEESESSDEDSEDYDSEDHEPQRHPAAQQVPAPATLVTVTTRKKVVNTQSVPVPVPTPGPTSSRRRPARPKPDLNNNPRNYTVQSYLQNNPNPNQIPGLQPGQHPQTVSQILQNQSQFPNQNIPPRNRRQSSIRSSISNTTLSLWTRIKSTFHHANRDLPLFYIRLPAAVYLIDLAISKIYRHGAKWIDLLPIGLLILALTRLDTFITEGIRLAFQSLVAISDFIFIWVSSFADVARRWVFQPGFRCARFCCIVGTFYTVVIGHMILFVVLLKIFKDDLMYWL